MALVVCNSGELILLENCLGKRTANNLVLNLYKNDATPAATSAVSDFTAADFTGYSDMTLATTAWGAAATNGSGEAEMSYGTAADWTAGSTQTVYGYFVKDGTTLVYAERFSSQQDLTSGSPLTFTPKLTGYSEN